MIRRRPAAGSTPRPRRWRRALVVLLVGVLVLTGFGYLNSSSRLAGSDGSGPLLLSR